MARITRLFFLLSSLTLVLSTFSCQPKSVPPVIRECPTAPAQLPRDLAAHDWALTEWWYYTGHLLGEDGRHYGFEVTFFKMRPDPNMVKSPAMKSVIGYMGHLSLTEEDIARYRNEMVTGFDGQFAGAAFDRYRVFIGDWSVEGDENSQRLRAANKEIGVDLTIVPGKPYVLHGDGGVVKKGGGLGNYYISNTRMRVRGAITVDGKPINVTGQAWFDHEFGYMGSTPVKGWDWFSLQLENNTEYMIYRIRRDGNGFAPESKACRIDAEGREECVPASDCDFEVLSRWKSPKTKGVYPATWRLRAPKLGLDATIIPTMPEQEFSEGLPYWEGSCKVLGQPANGSAYVELVGYAEIGPHKKLNPKK